MFGRCTEPAVERSPHRALTSGVCYDPWTHEPGRPVTYVLAVATFEIRNPVARLVLTEADDAPGNGIEGADMMSCAWGLGSCGGALLSPL